MFYETLENALTNATGTGKGLAATGAPRRQLTAEENASEKQATIT